MRNSSGREVGLKTSLGGGFEGLRKRSILFAAGILAILLFAATSAQAGTFKCSKGPLFYEDIDGGGGGNDYEVYDMRGRLIGILYLDGGGGGNDVLFYDGGGGGNDYEVYDISWKLVGTLNLDGGGGGNDGGIIIPLPNH